MRNAPLWSCWCCAGLGVLLLFSGGAARETPVGSPSCGIAGKGPQAVHTTAQWSPLEQPAINGVIRLLGVADSDLGDLAPFFRAVAIQGTKHVGGTLRIKADCDAALNPTLRSWIDMVTANTHARDAFGEQGTVTGLRGLLAAIRAGNLTSLWGQNSTIQPCATQGAAVPPVVDSTPCSNKQPPNNGPLSTTLGWSGNTESTGSTLGISTVRVMAMSVVIGLLPIFTGATDARLCLAAALLVLVSVDAQTTGGQNLSTTGATTTTGTPTTGSQNSPTTGASTGTLPSKKCTFGIEIAFECADGCGCPGQDSMEQAIVSHLKTSSIPLRLDGQANVSCWFACPPVYTTGVLGRPFISREDAHAATAPSVDGSSDWCTLITNNSAKLPAAQSSAPTLARGKKWLDAALGEHASVASFNVFSLQLLGLGAPSDLVTAAQRAALDEVAHAEASFAVAGRLLGHAVGPGSLPAVGEVQIATDAARVAQATAREGCVHEMTSTLEAALKLDRDLDRKSHADKLDADERRVLQMVVRDEARHAGLAWRVTAWLSTRFGVDVVNAVRDAVERELPAALLRLRTPGASEKQLQRAARVWSLLADGEAPKPEELESNFDRALVAIRGAAVPRIG
jgi:hypothetical protein